MVYCGAPSKGCERCRKRKIKCSQQPDGCSQCTRANQKCPGYRDQVDVIFRNESDNVVRKAKARAERAKKTKTDHSAKENTPVYPTPPDDAEECVEIVKQPPFSFRLDYNMVPSMEDIATGFFVSHYVIGFEQNGPTKGHLEHVLDLKKSHSIDDGLLASMQAVGLAGFSHAAGAPSLLVDARQRYLKAIQLTNTALRSPELAKKDSTLMGIMILGIFETVTGCNTRSVEAWAQHIQGAAALVKLRGREQLATPGGRRMFIQVVSSLLICCIQRQLPLPSHVVELTHEANDLIEITARGDPAWRVLMTMIRYAQFRADVKNKVLADNLIILEMALELDGIFQSIFDVPPKGWDYQIVYTDADPDIVWNGRYHIYYDHWISQLWNSMRSIRYLLNEKIRSTLLAGFTATPPYFTGIEHTAQFQIATDNMYQLQADILATVPQHIGYVTSFEGPTAAYDQKREYNPPSCEKALTKFPWSGFPEEQAKPSHTPEIRASGAYFLMWPLWFAGMMDIATEEMRQFVIRNLDLLADKMGILQARVLANVVRAQSDLFGYDD